MSEVEKLRQRLELLKVDPPRRTDEIFVIGRKMLEIADINMRIAEIVLERAK